MEKKLRHFLNVLISHTCTPSMVRDIVHEQPNLLNGIDSDGNTPLYLAIFFCQRPEIIRELLQLGADANIQCEDNNTALHCATQFYIDRGDDLFLVVQLLIKFGADVSLKNRLHKTPLGNLIFRRLKSGKKLLTKMLYVILKDGVGIDYISGDNTYLACSRDTITPSRLNLEVSKLFLEFGTTPEANLGLYELCRSVKRVSHNVQLAKLLMQYILVKDFKTGIRKIKKFVDNKQYDKIINLDSFSRHICYKEMIDYRYNLINELINMFRESINKKMSLFSFISSRCASGLKYDKSEENLYRRIIFIFHSNRYSCCYDLYQASIKRAALLSLLNKEGIFMVSSDLKVILTNDSILHMASYLSKKDLLNLLIAFWNATDRNKVPMKRSSDKVTSDRNIDLKDSYKPLIKRIKLKK